MIRFDSAALYAALDEQRLERGFTWKQVADEIGVAVPTVMRTRQGGRMEVDGMLAMVAWLDEKVERFVVTKP